jgi:hypothetical protein
MDIHTDTHTGHTLTIGRMATTADIMVIVPTGVATGGATTAAGIN